MSLQSSTLSIVSSARVYNKNDSKVKNAVNHILCIEKVVTYFEFLNLMK